MTFRTFYEIVRKENENIKNVEHFEKSKPGFLRIEYYPNVNVITNDIINIDPKAKHIPMDDVKDIEENEVRF